MSTTAWRQAAMVRPTLDDDGVVGALELGGAADVVVGLGEAEGRRCRSG